MLRNETLEEISDGRLYRSGDMVRADCQGCIGCSECCRDMEDTVVLDPLDVHRISTNLGRTPRELLSSKLALGFIDGLLLPHMAMDGPSKACVFLNPEGRCSIHAFRPGFCRMFPLGRYYEGDDFYYILQIHECPNKTRTKVKIKKWLETPELPRYEAYVKAWHDFLRDVRIVLSESEDQSLFEQMNRYILEFFYVKPYDAEEDFYLQFEGRLAEGREVL